jgi:hypothetical protein
MSSFLYRSSPESHGWRPDHSDAGINCTSEDTSRKVIIIMHRGCRSHLLPTTCLWLILMLKEPHFKILQNSTYKLMLLCVVSHDASTSYIKYMFQKEMESSQEFSPETCALYSMLWKLHNKESNKIFAILSTRRLYYKIYNGLWPLVLLFHHWTLPPASMESSARLVLLISTASGL